MPISSGNTLYVGGTGPGNYSKIQDAIDDVVDGDTIYVFNGTYYENLRIEKRIDLIGENRNTTYIKNSRNPPSTIIYISSDTENVLISGFTITGGYYGISIYSTNNIIKGNKVIFNEIGIYLDIDKTLNNKIINNLILHNNVTGIWDEDNGSTSSATWNVIGGNGKDSSSYPFTSAGIFKHRSGGIFHHNDFDNNWGLNVYTEGCGYGVWDDGSEGNYWDDWESNPGYPDVYIISTWGPDDTIDYHPKATSYFNYTIVLIKRTHYKINPGETFNIFTQVNKPPSSLSWFWQFGDSTTSNEISPTHSYESSGIYTIDVKVTDSKGQSDMDKCLAYVGIPPDMPTIKGPTKGRINTYYEYSIVADDSDSENITYYIDWGDWRDEYIGPVPSGKVINISHYWEYEYTYTIRVQAIDETFRESDWGELTIEIPRTRATSYHWFLERFPMLERLLNLLR